MNGKIDFQDELSLQTDISIKSFDLKPISPWLENLTGFQLTQGKLNTLQHLSVIDSYWQSQGEMALSDIQAIHTNNNKTSQEGVDLINIGSLEVAESLISSKEKRIILNQITLDRANGFLPLSQPLAINGKNPEAPNKAKNEAKSADSEQGDKEWRVIFGDIKPAN